MATIGTAALKTLTSPVTLRALARGVFGVIAGKSLTSSRRSRSRW
jgi:hypothetical protein